MSLAFTWRTLAGIACQSPSAFVFFGKLLMDFGEVSHRLGCLAGMGGIVSQFAIESGLRSVVARSVRRQFLGDLGVILVFHGMSGVVFGKLRVIARSLVRLRNLRELGIR
jgi:hypothetical protein